MRKHRTDTKGIGEGLPSVISPQMLADLFGLSVKTIYDWVSQGRLDNCSRKRGKHWLINRDCAVEEIMSGKDWK